MQIAQYQKKKNRKNLSPETWCPKEGWHHACLCFIHPLTVEPQPAEPCICVRAPPNPTMKHGWSKGCQFAEQKPSAIHKFGLPSVYVLQNQNLSTWLSMIWEFPLWNTFRLWHFWCLPFEERCCILCCLVGSSMLLNPSSNKFGRTALPASSSAMTKHCSW